MRKRPLLVLCLAAALLVSLLHLIRDDTEALSAVQDFLSDSTGTDGILSAEGTVRTCDKVSEGLRLTLDHITIQTSENSSFTLSSDLKLTLTTENLQFLPGDILRAVGRYLPFEEAANPGQFDEKAYYFSLRTVGRLGNAELTRLSEGRFGLRRILARLRRILSDSYLRVLEEKDARTAAAICLGEKAWMQTEWKQVYQEGGIAHMIAVSGLHISLIGMGLFRLLRRAGRGFIFCALPSALAVSAYAVMAGFSVSAFRACLMFLIWLGAQAAGRKYDMLTGAAVAAVVILGTNPGALTQSSFLLSFGAILSLCLLAPRLQAQYLRKRPGFLQVFRNSLSSSAAVWLGTLPLTLCFFYQCAPWSILVNLAVVPLMSVLMVSGLACCTLGLFSVSAGIFAGAPVHYLLLLFEALCSLEKRLPGGVMVAGCPAAAALIAYYALLACAVRFSLRQSRFAWRKFALLVACALFLLIYHPRSGLCVTCLDVGQGDSALLRFADGTNALIDGGSSSTKRVWEYRISPAVKYYGIRTLDYVFLSHDDSDHTNGIAEYLEAFEPGFGGRNAHGITIRNLVLPPTADPEDFTELKEAAARAGIRLLKLKAGGSVSAGGRGGWSLSCLAPLKLSGEKNEDSMVLKLRFGDFQMLFTGDLEGEAENRLAGSGEDLNADVFKVGHHGSKGASNEAFLAAVSPAVGIISCAEHNSYGHPSAEAVERLHNAGIAILATMECGAVTIRSDGIRYSAKGYKKTVNY